MPRRDLAWLSGMAAVFLAWHLPLLSRIRPGQDEDFYGVPGMAILRGGLPQIPYIPSRDPSTIYYRADEVLYTLPPLGFYLEAACHLVFGDGIGPSRLASVISGVVAFGLVYGLSRGVSGSSRAALFASGAYLFSRAFAFPATTARPDMAAVAFGLGALWWVNRRGDRPLRKRDAALGGLSAGLAMLCHPIGIVPAAQGGLGTLTGPGTIRHRLLRGSAFGIAALSGFGLWLPLIALRPELARIQFVGNVLGRAGPGMLGTLLDLPGVLAFQFGLFVEHVGPIQAALYASGMIGMAFPAARGDGAARRAMVGAASASALLMLFMGRHHIRDYYAYPAALLSVPLGMLADRVVVAFESRIGRVVATAVVAGAMAAALVPGSGLRVLAAHLRDWDDPDYRVEAFTDRIMADLPEGALVAADGAYVLEFYVRDWPVVEAIVDPFYYDVRVEPFEYAVFGPIGLEQVRPKIDGLEFVRSYGDRDDPFGHYAELYRRR